MIIEIKHYDTTITIEQPRDDLDIYEVVEEMVRPMLLAMGFHQDSINSAIGEPR